MTFEEILRSELITVTNLNNKVYPLVAPKNEDAPFLVYRKGNTAFSKTLDGIELKYDSTYSIVVLAKTYASLQQLESDVIDKLISFIERNISGLLIRNVTVSINGNDYVEELDWYRSDIDLQVKY